LCQIYGHPVLFFFPPTRLDFVMAYSLVRMFHNPPTPVTSNTIHATSLYVPHFHCRPSLSVHVPQPWNLYYRQGLFLPPIPHLPCGVLGRHPTCFLYSDHGRSSPPKLPIFFRCIDGPFSVLCPNTPMHITGAIP